jgi:hypothetical protein
MDILWFPLVILAVALGVMASNSYCEGRKLRRGLSNKEEER